MQGTAVTQFIGRFYHALEQKGRVSIPVSFRQYLKSGGVITRGLDGCLFLFPQVTWDELVSGALNSPLTQKRARDWVRLLANSAVPVKLDNLGRLLIPEYLIELAMLKKQVVVVGSLNRIEVWDQTQYHHYMKELDTNAEAIAESVGSPGLKEHQGV